MQAKDLGAQAERLDRRTGKLVRGARKYRDGLGGMAYAQTGFADTLREFCGGPDGCGTDEESMSIGDSGPATAAARLSSCIHVLAPATHALYSITAAEPALCDTAAGSGTVSRFIEVFQDLGSASDLLRGQVRTHACLCSSPRAHKTTPARLQQLTVFCCADDLQS